MARAFTLVSLLFLGIVILTGCEQAADDPDNAIISGYVYADLTYSVGVEGVQVFVESDKGSPTPYAGPDIIGYTDSNGHFEIPVYLGHTPIKSCEGDIIGYDYIYYADVRVLCAFKDVSYDFGGGITLEAGKKFNLYNIHLGQFSAEKE